MKKTPTNFRTQELYYKIYNKISPKRCNCEFYDLKYIFWKHTVVIRERLKFYGKN